MKVTCVGSMITPVGDELLTACVTVTRNASTVSRSSSRAPEQRLAHPDLRGGVEGGVVSELREEVHPGTEEYGDQSTRPDTTRSLMSTRVWAPEGSSRCRLRCHPGASRALEVAGVDRARRKAPRCCRRRGRGIPLQSGEAWIPRSGPVTVDRASWSPRQPRRATATRRQAHPRPCRAPLEDAGVETHDARCPARLELCRADTLVVEGRCDLSQEVADDTGDCAAVRVRNHVCSGAHRDALPQRRHSRGNLGLPRKGLGPALR